MKNTFGLNRILFRFAFCIFSISFSVFGAWTLVWQDEFNESTLDTAKWIAVTNCGDKRNSEQQCYMSSAISVSNGSLIITGSNMPQTGFAYTSGAVKTGKKFTVAYGKIEFKTQMPQGGQGVWPALWLYPPTQWPPEIDVLEAVNTMSTIYMTYHWGTSADHKSDGGSTTITNHSDWHTYAVEWDTGAIRWYIDGVQKKAHTSTNVTSIPMQLYINLALGGTWPGSVNTTTEFPQTLKVDYVRVYKQSTALTHSPRYISRSNQNNRENLFTLSGGVLPTHLQKSFRNGIVIIKGRNNTLQAFIQ